MSRDEPLLPPDCPLRMPITGREAAAGGPAGISGVLILRVWQEDSAAAGLRIRILARPDISKSAEDSMTTGLIDEAAEFVRSWLIQFSSGPAGR